MWTVVSFNQGYLGPIFVRSKILHFFIETGLRFTEKSLFKLSIVYRKEFL